MTADKSARNMPSLAAPEQPGQLGEIYRHAPRLILRAHAGLPGHIVVITKIETAERLPIGVVNTVS
jgi:hypothetical protein